MMSAACVYDTVMAYLCVVLPLNSSAGWNAGLLTELHSGPLHQVYQPQNTKVLLMPSSILSRQSGAVPSVAALAPV